MARPSGKTVWRKMTTAPKDRPILLLEREAYIEGNGGPFGRDHVGLGRWIDRWEITWEENGLEWVEAEPEAWADITVPEADDDGD